MPKFRVTKHYLSGYSATIEAPNKEEAEKIYDDMSLDEMREDYVGHICAGAYHNEIVEVKG